MNSVRNWCRVCRVNVRSWWRIVSDYRPKGSQKRYGEFTVVEKLLPPFLNYIIRKLVLGLVVVLLTVSRVLSGLFDFEIDAGVSDRDEWIWLDDKELPVVTLDSKKVNTKSQ
jgi:hypothetical protein